MPKLFLFCRNVFLENLDEELRCSNILSASRIFNFLSIFDGINSKYGNLDMTWLNHWNNFESTLQPNEIANLTNALNQVYGELFNYMCTRSSTSQANQFDFVIVAHGSIGAPIDGPLVHLPMLENTIVIPSQLCFATNYVSSVTFYQPWGVLLDARANYGIVNGSITPNRTRFVNLWGGDYHPASIPHTLPRFNVLQSGDGETIPHVWCNPIRDDDRALRRLLHYINNGPAVRPFVWWRAGSVPSYFLTSLASIATMVLSINAGRAEVRIHHGQCLVWPSRTNAPPAALQTLNQYYNAVQEAHMQQFAMTLL